MKKNNVIIITIILLILGWIYKLMDTSEKVIISEKTTKFKTASRKIASASKSDLINTNRHTNNVLKRETNTKESGPISSYHGQTDESYTDEKISEVTNRSGRMFQNNSITDNGRLNTVNAQIPAFNNNKEYSDFNESTGTQSRPGGFFGTIPNFSSSNNSTISNPSGSDNSNKTSTPPVCNISNSGGTFNNKVTLEISCTTNANIQYCIAEECCDPSDGITYTGPFEIVGSNTNLCVSYSGTSASNNLTSVVKEAVFSFDPIVPHLEIVQNSRYIQTTQLDGSMIIRSNDFGKNEYSLGVVNLFTHDFTNLSCKDIEEQHSTFTNPAAETLLAETQMNQYQRSEQLNLSLPLNQLVYGLNHLAAFAKAEFNNETTYACSKSLLTLEDFHLSQSIPLNQISSGDTSIFGGFMPFNTLNSESINRTPANSNDFKLKFGLINIFFEK